MFKERSSIDDRIVSISQQHVRPIVNSYSIRKKIMFKRHYWF